MSTVAIFAENFPIVSGLRPDKFAVNSTRDLSIEEIYELTALASRIGTGPARVIICAAFDNRARVSPQMEVGLRLCELFLDDRRESLKRRKLAESISEALPKLEITLPKKLSGQAGLKRLELYALALVNWCFEPLVPGGKREAFIEGLFKYANRLAQHDIIGSSLQSAHQFFHEMKWANDITDYTDRTVALFVTKEKYFEQQSMFADQADQADQTSPQVALYQLMKESYKAKQQKMKEREPGVRERHPFEANSTYAFSHVPLGDS